MRCSARFISSVYFRAVTFESRHEVHDFVVFCNCFTMPLFRYLTSMLLLHDSRLYGATTRATCIQQYCTLRHAVLPGRAFLDQSLETGVWRCSLLRCSLLHIYTFREYFKRTLRVCQIVQYVTTVDARLEVPSSDAFQNATPTPVPAATGISVPR